MRKQSIRRGVWSIGRKRQQQTGGFFPIGASARPVIGGIASNLAGPFLIKIFGGKRRRRRRQ